MLRWVLPLALCVVCAGTDKAKKVKPGSKPSLARGWGGSLEWAPSYEEALSKMVESQKPLMVIHHKEDCRFSKALKKAFAGEKSIQRMAKDFIMLNVVEETSDRNLAPDGYYVPRILFVDPSLKVRTDIRGKYSNRWYAYEPGDMADLLGSMKKAKAILHNEL